jgi:hypothetical protein
MRAVQESPWGRLFQNWEKLTPDERGFPEVGEANPEFVRNTAKLVRMAFNILGTCIVEAPEIDVRRRRVPAH